MLIIVFWVVVSIRTKVAKIVLWYIEKEKIHGLTYKFQFFKVHNCFMLVGSTKLAQSIEKEKMAHFSKSRRLFSPHCHLTTPQHGWGYHTR